MAVRSVCSAGTAAALSARRSPPSALQPRATLHGQMQMNQMDGWKQGAASICHE